MNSCREFADCTYFISARLCVVLFTKQGQQEKEKLVLRLLARDKKYSHEKRVQFLYLYEDVQTEALWDLKEGMKEDKCADNSTAPKVKIWHVTTVAHLLMDTSVTRAPLCNRQFSWARRYQIHTISTSVIWTPL